ncbi:MAG: hypothetical protein ABI758_01535 [Candidatus Woesebacteria bacterium]
MEEKKPSSEDMGRREFLQKLGLAVALLAAGGAEGFILGRSSAETQSIPDFEPFIYFGDGYTVQRSGEKEFIVTDTRSGNTLPPDRMAFLNTAVEELQNRFGCIMITVIEREKEHDLLITVEDEKCILSAATKK